MAMMGISSTAPAFGRIAEFFGVSEAGIGLIVTFFTLPGVIFAPLFGILADRYGRKKVLVPSLAVFGIAGGLCGMARDFDLLLVLTFIQGIGNASLGAINVTLIGDLFRGSDQIKAMGYNNSVLSLGTAFYPLAGGILAEFGWNIPFYMPFASLLVALFVMLYLDNPEPVKRLTLKEYVMASARAIRSPAIYVHFILSIIMFILLFGPVITYLPFLVSTEFGFTPYTTGLVLMTLSLTAGVISTQLGRISAVFSSAALLKIGFLFYSAGLFFIFIYTNEYLIFPAMIIYGLGHGLIQPTVLSRLAGMVTDESRAVFMSINRMNSILGQTLGPVIFSVIFTAYGMDGVYTGGGMFALGTAVLLFIFLKK